VRAPVAIVVLCLLSPSLGLADDLSGATVTAPGRELEEFQRWTAQRRLEAGVRLENQKRDAERAFDRSQEDMRLHRIEQRLDQLEQSRGTR
jgi:hypothetical protein